MYTLWSRPCLFLLQHHQDPCAAGGGGGGVEGGGIFCTNSTAWCKQDGRQISESKFGLILEAGGMLSKSVKAQPGGSLLSRHSLLLCCIGDGLGHLNTLLVDCHRVLRHVVLHMAIVLGQCYYQAYGRPLISSLLSSMLVDCDPTSAEEFATRLCMLVYRCALTGS